LEQFSFEKYKKIAITIAITEFNSKSKTWKLPLILPLNKPNPQKIINKTNPSSLVFITPICCGTVFKCGSSVFKSIISNYFIIKINIKVNFWKFLIILINLFLNKVFICC
jgi:hypothetical protein